MDPRISRLKTVAECEIVATNARERGAPDLAYEARKRAVQIRAQAHGASTNVEQDCLQAVYAYEEVLSSQKGRRQTAARTWQMIRRHGVIPAVERVVTKRELSSGFAALAAMGLQDYAFESVVLRYPESFSAEAVVISQERMASK